MKSETVKASFEKDGRSAERTGTVQQAENVQDLLTIFKGDATKLVKYVNDALFADEKSNLYQQARLEIVGVDDKIERLADRINRDRKALGKAEFSKEKALEIAKAQLAD